MRKFIVRTYGIWIKDQTVLISHESLNGFSFTKFPGGGVEIGEGIMDALIREMEEETGVLLNPNEIQHFYTTDFYQQSAFNPNDQIVSVYYHIHSNKRPLFHQKDESTQTKQQVLKTEWLPLNHISTDLFTFPIDKKVCEMMRNTRWFSKRM